MAVLYGIPTGPGPEYNADKTVGRSRDCLGNLRRWKARWDYEYAGDRHWAGPFDKDAPGLHANLVPLGGDRFRCSRCRKVMRDSITGAIHRPYPERPFQNEGSPWR